MRTDEPPDGSDPRLPTGTGIGRVALRVADAERATAFYRDVVGLEPLSRAGGVATLGADGDPLIVLESDPDAPERDRSEAGLYHAAIRVPSRAALGDALARVRSEWSLEGASDHGVSEALYLSDPEGNGVEIYRDRPRSEWTVRDDGRVRLVTEPLDLDAVAAAATGAAAAPAGTDVGHVHLEVAALDAFESFYVDAVGFARSATVPDARFVAAGGYHHHLGANRWSNRTTPAAAGRGLSWFEVTVPDEGAVRAVRDRLAAAGRDPTAVEGGIAVTDPDGIEVRFRATDRRG